jgi:hypothetical protein
VAWYNRIWFTIWLLGWHLHRRVSKAVHQTICGVTSNRNPQNARQDSRSQQLATQLARYASSFVFPPALGYRLPQGVSCREPTNQCIRNHCQRALTSVRTNLLLSFCLPQDMFGAASQPISPSLTTVKVRLLICVSACPELSCASGCIECREPTNQSIFDYCQCMLVPVATNPVLSWCVPQGVSNSTNEPVSAPVTIVKVRLPQS